MRGNGCEPTGSGEDSGGESGAGRGGANRCLGGRRAGLLRDLALLAGGTITVGAGRGTSPARSGDGRRLPLHPLVEDVLRWRLHQGVPIGYGLDGRVVPSGRPAGRADPRRLGRLADVGENPRHRGGLDGDGHDAHLGIAVGAATTGSAADLSRQWHGPEDRRGLFYRR